MILDLYSKMWKVLVNVRQGHRLKQPKQYYSVNLSQDTAPQLRSNSRMVNHQNQAKAVQDQKSEG